MALGPHIELAAAHSRRGASGSFGARPIESITMGRFAPIRDQDLLRTIANFPPDWRDNESKRSFWLAVSIVKYFFGQEWVDEHVSPERTTAGFLRVPLGEGTDTQISTFKIVDFAELLFNLQDILGFDTCIDRIRRGVIEPTFAELDLGRMLYSGNVEFRFVEPQQTKGLDYDIEITLSDGLVVCADAKCKAEATDFSVDSVRHSLKKARTQFPENRPSIIFMKVPHRWFEEPIHGVSLNSIAETFLRETGRIVSVKFYVSHIGYRDKAISHDLTFKEISNPNNRFDPARDWNMFAEPNAKSGWNGMPPRWKRLVFFPNDGPT